MSTGNTPFTEDLRGFVERLRGQGIACLTGRFGAMMKIELVNDGPVTILLES